jgi:peroxiredoxin
MQFAKLSVNRPARQSLVVTAAVKKGDKIPAFSLKDQNGRAVNVKPGGKPKVIFFYPKVRATPITPCP